jgi:glutamate dehydrogenase
MTDEVAHQVLRDNYEQNVLLGNARAQEGSMVSVHERLIDWLEEHAELDRNLEFLPSRVELEKRHAAGKGLKSPEFSVLIAYAKLSLKSALLAGELPDDPWFATTLAEYFPKPIRERYAEQLAGHPLRREIVVNSVANSIINRGGITFVFRAIEESGATPEQVARAFVAAREVFRLGDYVRQVEALDNVVTTGTQTDLYLEFRRLLDRAVRWFLSARPSRLDIAAEIERFAGPAAELRAHVPDLLRGSELKRLQRRVKELEAHQVPPEVAARAAGLLDEYSVLDIVDLASEAGEEPAKVAALYYFCSERFGIDAMLSRVTKLPRDDQWDALARGAVRDDLYTVLEGLTRSVIEVSDPSAEPAERYEAWAHVNSESVHRAKRALSGIARLDRPNLAAISVALRTLRTVARSGPASGVGES